jgi:hypothetical protein
MRKARVYAAAPSAPRQAKVRSAHVDKKFIGSGEAPLQPARNANGLQ